MLVGYMRVSTTDDRQTVDLQRDALVATGVDHRHLHTDKASGARDDRPGLKACLDYLNAGDTLIVWKLDRLGRSLPHLLTIITDLKARGIAFRLVEAMGVLPREGIASEIKELDQDARGALRKHGVRFGQFTIFMPALLKPAPTRLRLVLWRGIGKAEVVPDVDEARVLEVLAG